jgi:deoxyribodipyrimidine photo-lyase
MTFEQIRDNPRVLVRRPGPPDLDGAAVIYWMQRAQRAADNPALDVAIEIGNLLQKPVVVFLGLTPFVRRANLRHYRFLVEGLEDLAAGLRSRRVGLLLRTYPHHRLAPVADELHAVMVIGDENLSDLLIWRFGDLAIWRFGDLAI